MDGCAGSVWLVVVFWTTSRITSMYWWASSGVASTVRGLGEGTGEPFRGAAVVTGLLPLLIPFSQGRALALEGLRPCTYVRSLTSSDTVSGLGGHSCQNWGD